MRTARGAQLGRGGGLFCVSLAWEIARARMQGRAGNSGAVGNVGDEEPLVEQHAGASRAVIAHLFRSVCTFYASLRGTTDRGDLTLHLVTCSRVLTILDPTHPGRGAAALAARQTNALPKEAAAASRASAQQRLPRSGAPAGGVSPLACAPAAARPRIAPRQPRPPRPHRAPG